MNQGTPPNRPFPPPGEAPPADPGNQPSGSQGQPVQAQAVAPVPPGYGPAYGGQGYGPPGYNTPGAPPQAAPGHPAYGQPGGYGGPAPYGAQPPYGAPQGYPSPGAPPQIPGVQPAGYPVAGAGAGYAAPATGAHPSDAASLEQGREVTINGLSFRLPSTCASCGAPQQTSRTTSKMNSYGARRVTRSFQVPYCNACAARARSFGVKGGVLAAAALGISLVLAVVPFVVTGIPLAVALLLALVVAIGFGVAAMTALAPKAPPLPATTQGNAVRLVKFNSATSTLHCSNAAWAEEFARMNNALAQPRKRGHGFGIGALVTGLLVGPVGAGVAWAVAHPSVHVDNATAESIQLWIDGQPSIVVPSNQGGAVPPSVDVSYGSHKFGYSKSGASQPEATVDADVTMHDAHLYNPGKTACYWLDADAYGSATVHGIVQGPQPIKEFYSFDKVDTWFGGNPQSITVQNGNSGGTRVALQRASECMELARANCPVAAREALIDCERGARDDASFDACTAKARASCGGTQPPSSPSPSTPAAPTHVTPPPHPAPQHSAHTAPPSSGHGK